MEQQLMDFKIDYNKILNQVKNKKIKQRKRENSSQWTLENPLSLLYRYYYFNLRSNF